MSEDPTHDPEITEVESNTDTTPIPSHALSQTSNHYIDKITMELMMNRSHYKKYLANTDPVRFQETQEKSDKIVRARQTVVEMTDTLLGEFIRHAHSTKYNTEVSDAFETYMNLCLTYLDDYPPDGTRSNDEEDGDYEDDDMLFGPSTNAYRKTSTRVSTNAVNAYRSSISTNAFFMTSHHK